MRVAVAALLIAAPLALVTWIVWTGRAPVRAAGTVSSPTANATTLQSLFDGLPAGIKLSAPAKLYDEKGLFDYIDGAAPIFIERKFRELAAAEVTIDGAGDAVADIYDMTASDNAASIFQKERSPSARPLEGFDEAVTSSMSLVFRKGRFYVKLTAFDAKGEAALPNLARALAARM